MTIFNKETNKVFNELNPKSQYYTLSNMAWGIDKKLHERNDGARTGTDGITRRAITGLKHHIERTTDTVNSLKGNIAKTRSALLNELAHTNGEVHNDTRIARNPDGTPMYGASLDTYTTELEEYTESLVIAEDQLAQYKTEVNAYEHLYNEMCIMMGTIASTIIKEEPEMASKFSTDPKPQYNNPKGIQWKATPTKPKKEGSVFDRLQALGIKVSKDAKIDS